MIARKYGVVYTPDRLADFAAELLCAEIEKSEFDSVKVLDPACGECALLDSVKKIKRNEYEYIGIDVDKDAILSASSEYIIINNDTILPKNVRKRTAEFWTGKLPTINAVIANPPWSSEKIYNRDDLRNAGYELTAGQYDSFVLFLELAYKIVCENGIFAFIIPDSIFDSQNENLRRFLIRNTEIKVIARLGEKLFDEVNRATTIIVCKKRKPNEQSITKCFRLSTNDRKRYLLTDIKLIDIYKENVHQVLQRRFLENPSCNFDVDTRREEENLIAKIKSNSITWEDKFNFGRGVEISKSGKVVFCSKCGCAQGYKKSQFEKSEKICTYCGEKIIVSDKTIKSVISKQSLGNDNLIYVGENVKRYGIEGGFYIKTAVPGINYKNLKMYTPPKLLIRKTGLGIYASIDYTGSMTSQTVYILKLKDRNDNTPLEYYLALLNSRVVYYFYLKVYGENEWKSHPYLTKQIIYSLPIQKYTQSALDTEIVKLARELVKEYEHSKDLQLEKLICQKYNLTDAEIKLIYDEMNRLPDLGAVNNMKVEVEASV